MWKMSHLITDPVTSAKKAHKYLGIFWMLWVTVLIVWVFTSLKTFHIGNMVFAVSVIAYPFVYVFNDIFTEVYGYRVTRKIIRTGLWAMLLATILASLYSYIPNPDFEYNEAFNLVFRASPIVGVGSVFSFFFWELTNSYIVAKMKIWTKGKYERLRFIGSTLGGQMVDNSVFFLVAFLFAGWYSAQEVLPLIITTVIFCTVWEIIALPITQRVVKIIKEKEWLDTYDYGTNFNPFALKE